MQAQRTRRVGSSSPEWQERVTEELPNIEDLLKEQMPVRHFPAAAAPADEESLPRAGIHAGHISYSMNCRRWLDRLIVPVCDLTKVAHSLPRLGFEDPFPSA